jgi:elongation factor Tu
MVSPSPYRRPPRPPDLEARVTFLAPESGGRTTPIASGYRPNHNFGLPGELNDAQHEYPDCEWVQPGQTVKALLWLLAPERQTGRLYPGFSFTVQEGGRIVGNASVVAVLNNALVRKDEK